MPLPDRGSPWLSPTHVLTVQDASSPHRGGAACMRPTKTAVPPLREKEACVPSYVPSTLPASPQHAIINQRLEALIQTEIGGRSEVLRAARDSSLSMYHFAWLCEASSRQQRRDFLEHYQHFFAIGGVRTAAKLGATTEAARACAALQQVSSHASLLHTMEGYSWDADYGPGGRWLGELVGWYEHAQHSQGFKQANGRDALLSGLGSAMLLLRWGPGGADGLVRHGAELRGGGEVAAAVDPSSWRACTEAWASITSEVQIGKLAWRNHRIDLVDQRATRAIMFALRRLDVAGRLFDSSPEGAYFHRVVLPQWDRPNWDSDAEANAPPPSEDETARRRQATHALAAHVQSLCQYAEHWGMQCTWSEGSFELLARAVGTLLLLGVEGGERSRASGGGRVGTAGSEGPLRLATLSARVTRAAPTWLPSPSSLLAIAQTERAWDVFMTGMQHPSLACALVAARLGRWAEAQAVAEGLTRTLHQPLTLIEARRLLARCASALGASAAVEVRLHQLRLAATDAASAGYLWLEASTRRQIDGGGGGRGESGADGEKERGGGAEPGGDGHNDEPGSSASEQSRARDDGESHGEGTDTLSGAVAGSDPGVLVRAARKATKKRVRFARTVAPDLVWASEVDPARLLRGGVTDAVSASSSGQLLFKSRRPAAKPVAHVAGVGMLDDATLSRSKSDAEVDKAADRFLVRTTRSVKSLRLPTGL